MKILALDIATHCNYIWKPVDGADGIYMVNNVGQVKRAAITVRYERYGKKIVANKPEKILTLSKTKKGYISVYVIDKHMPVHRLVAKAFVLNPENKPFVNHINGIKDDNRVENLEWCTASENTLHGYALGLMPSRSGENSGTSKLKEKDVIKIRELGSKGVSHYKIAAQYNIDRSNVDCIVNRKTWKHI